MDLGEWAGKKARCNRPELRNTTFVVAIRQVLNGNNDQTSSMQLQASYTNVRHREELIHFIEQNCSPKEPYCLTVIYKCNLSQEELDKEYMGLYAPGQMINDHLSSHILFNSSISNAFKLKPGHHVKLFLVEMKSGTGKDIAEHVIKPVKVFPRSCVPVRYAPLLIRILRLRREPMRMKDWWVRRKVGKRQIVVIM
jgi:hypothetical protein